MTRKMRESNPVRIQRREQLIVLVVIGLVTWSSVGIAAFVVVAASPAPEPTPATVQITLPACPTEDSSNCFWDASVSGNQQGVSFIDWNGVTYYEEVSK